MSPTYQVQELELGWGESKKEEREKVLGSPPIESTISETQSRRLCRKQERDQLIESTSAGVISPQWKWRRATGRKALSSPRKKLVISP